MRGLRFVIGEQDRRVACAQQKWMGMLHPGSGSSLFLASCLSIELG